MFENFCLVEHIIAAHLRRRHGTAALEDPVDS
jgi:hypothetical protein